MLAGHEVQFVDDREMPDGIDWLMIEAPPVVIWAVRRSRVCPQVLEEAWGGYRDLVAS